MNYHKVYMNQIQASSLLTELAQMWKSQSLCDAVIKAGNSNTKAHRLVLVAACPMLKSMENASVGSHLEVQLASDIKQDSVHTFLQYLYEGFMTLTEENYKEVEKIGRVLQVDSIIKCCADFYECLHSSSEYRYSYHDHVEFKHVRQSDMLKVQEKRISKRKPDSVRPFNTVIKRPKSDTMFNSDSSDSHAVKADDQISMSRSYTYKSPFKSLRKIGPASFMKAQENKLKQETSKIKICRDSVQIMQRDQNGNACSQDNSVPSCSSPSLQISVASEVHDVNTTQVVNAVTPVDSNDTPVEPVMPVLPCRPNLIGPFTQGVARQPEVYYSTSTPVKDDNHRSLLSTASSSAKCTISSNGYSTVQNSKPKVGPKSKTKCKDLKSILPNLSMSKKDMDNVGSMEMYIDMADEGIMHVRHNKGSDNKRTQRESDDGSIRDDMEIEEPPPDDVKVTADHSGIWYGEKVKDENDVDDYEDSKKWQSMEDTSQSLDNSLAGEETDALAGHRLIRIEGCKKACAYCDISRVKTKSGWQIKSYFKCEACDVPLCKSSKDCFVKYHELRMEQPDITPKELQKRMKAHFKPVQIHNVNFGGATDLQSYMDMAPPLVAISPTNSMPSPQHDISPVNNLYTSHNPSSEQAPPPVMSSSQSSNLSYTSSNRKAPPLVAMTVHSSVSKHKTGEGGDSGMSGEDLDVPSLVPPPEVSASPESRPSDIIIQ